jgi:hypothetical protein
LNLKPWSARTLYVYAHADLVQIKILRWSAGDFCLQVVLPGRKLFFPALLRTNKNLDIFPYLILASPTIHMQELMVEA